MYTGDSFKSFLLEWKTYPRNLWYIVYVIHNFSSQKRSEIILISNISLSFPFIDRSPRPTTDDVHNLCNLASYSQKGSFEEEGPGSCLI